MEKTFLVLLFLACLLLPVSPAIANIILLVFGGGIVIETIIKKNFPPRKTWLQLLVLPSFFFLWMLIGTLLSPFKKEGFNLVEIAIPFMVLSLAYIFASVSIKEKARDVISFGIMAGVAGSLVYLIISLGVNFSNSSENSILGIFSHRFSNFNFTNPIHTHPSYYSIWILAANYFVYNSKKIKASLKWILLLLFLVGLVFTMSRVGIFLYLLQIIGVFFYLSKKGKIIYGVGFIAILIVGVYLYNYQLKNVYFLQRLSLELAWDANPENSGSVINNRAADDSRTARWLAILDTVKEKPLLGYGVGSERAVLDKTYAENGLEISLERKYNTHNQYLFYLLEQGVIGLLLFLSFFFVSLSRAVKSKDLFTMSFIIGIMVVFFFENYMYRSMGYLTIALFLTFMKKSQK